MNNGFQQMWGKIKNLRSHAFTCLQLYITERNVTTVNALVHVLLCATLAYLVVCADVDGDGEAGVRRNAGQGRVQGELAHRDAHTVRPQVAQTQDPLAVRHHDRLLT